MELCVRNGNANWVRAQRIVAVGFRSRGHLAVVVEYREAKEVFRRGQMKIWLERTGMGSEVIVYLDKPMKDGSWNLNALHEYVPYRRFRRAGIKLKIGEVVEAKIKLNFCLRS